MDLVEPTWPEFQGAVRGIVVKAPSALGAPFEVVVPSFSSEHSYEIRRWSARGLTKPAVGDEVLVVEDDSGLPWVPAWWPAGGDVALQELLPTHPHDFGIVTALPTKEPTPAAGDLCTFKAATGVYWRLQYTGEATYPWAKVGGPPLRNYYAGSVTTASSTYQTTNAPSITAPLAMEVDISIGTLVQNNQVAELNEVAISAYVGSTSVFYMASISSTTFAGAGGSLTFRSVAAKSDVIQTRYHSGQSKLVAVAYPSIALDPVRVG